MADVVLDHVIRQFGNDNRSRAAVDDVSLTIEDGEFLILVGPSGCGKTTLLRIIAGLEDLTGGQVLVGGRAISNLPPRERDVAMVFQNYALYAHLSVRENLSFPLKQRKRSKAEIEARVGAVARSMGLTDLLDRKPGKLSGGQRQRVAMGRAMVREPAVFLMDEPLSNLDAKLRVQMRAEVMRIQRELGVTTIYVTHDQVEAMTMGDRVAVLADGRLQQCDTPDVLYRSPRNLFVASFIGSPAMNVFNGVLGRAEDGSPTVAIGEHTVPLPADGGSPERHGPAGRELTVGIRPQDLVDPAFGHEELPTLPITVDLVENLGSERIVHFRLDGVELAETPWDTREAGEPARPAVAVLPGASRVAAGDTTRLGVRPEHLHFFDRETGLAVGRE